MEAELKSLECHFTWNLEPPRSKLHHLREVLEDLSAEDGCCWLGHVHNMLGFILHKLDSKEEALSAFKKATQSFGQLRGDREGRWLLVNYRNLAWMHLESGDETEAKAYLCKAEALLPPAGSQRELHADVCAEKAWTLMHFGVEEKRRAAGYFQKAIQMQPRRVEWQTRRLITRLGISKDLREDLSADTKEEVKAASRRDPGSPYLAALALNIRAAGGEDVQQEARELAGRVFGKPLSRYSGIEPLLKLFNDHLCIDELIELAEEALRRYPGVRFAKKCAALFYKKKIFDSRGRAVDRREANRAAELHKEVIELYPQSSLKTRVYLASIYSNTGNQEEAVELYKDLMEHIHDYDPEERQMILYYYSNYLYFHQKDYAEAVRYQMKAAEIECPSYYRDRCLQLLEKNQNRQTPPINREIRPFLERLQLGMRARD